MPFADHWNLKEGYAMRAGSRRGLGTMTALRRLGIPPTGTHHRGIDDARDLARMLPYILGREASSAAAEEPAASGRSPAAGLAAASERS